MCYNGICVCVCSNFISTTLFFGEKYIHYLRHLLAAPRQRFLLNFMNKFKWGGGEKPSPLSKKYSMVKRALSLSCTEALSWLQQHPSSVTSKPLCLALPPRFSKTKDTFKIISLHASQVNDALLVCPLGWEHTV